MKVIIASASPDELNPNLYLLDIIAEEAQSLPDVTAIRCMHTDLPRVLQDIGKCLVLVAGSLMGRGATLHRVSTACTAATSQMVYWSWDDPYELDVNRECSTFFDRVFTNDQSSVFFYLRPDRTHYLPLAASVQAHYRPITSARPMWDWLMVGHGFGRRRAVAEALARSAPDLVGVVSGGGWNGSDATNLVPSPIRNSSLSDLYNRSGCVLSIGRELMLANRRFEVPAVSVGPRVYETALAGGPQVLMPWSRASAEEGSLATAVVVNDEEITETVRHLLHARSEVLDRCREAQRVVLERHLYRHRIAEILETVA